MSKASKTTALATAAAEVHAQSPFLRRVDQYIRAGYQDLCLDTSELGRVMEELLQMPAAYEYDAVLTWDCVEGLVIAALRQNLVTQKHKVGTVLHGQASTAAAGGAGNTTTAIPLKSPLAVLEYVLDHKALPFRNCLVILKNFHIFLKDPAVGQKWQNATVSRLFNTVIAGDDAKSGQRQEMTLCRFPLILGTAVMIPPALVPTITKIDYQLPDLPHMRDMFSKMQDTLIESCRADHETVPEPASPDFAEQISRTLLGMTSIEASDALSLCGITHASLSKPEVLDTIEHQKAEIIGSTPGLTYIHRHRIADIDAVGGFDLFRKWIRRMRHCYSPQAESLKIDRPKGVVLIGVPGSGKSLVGKVTAKQLGLPLVLLDVGAIFGSLVGESERRMSDALRTIEAMQGAVVLVDEADKLWGGANDATGDSGVTRRVFGKFLTWLAEKKDGSFVIMTMNRVFGLPPEFLRKGRFDEIWYTDIPNEEERKQIFDIHMRLRGLDPKQICRNDADWAQVLRATNDFVGAEVENVIVQARLEALELADTAVPTIDLLVEAAESTVPLSTLDGENITQIREFCRERARPVASSQEDDLPPAATGSRRMSTKKHRGSDADA